MLTYKHAHDGQGNNYFYNEGECPEEEADERSRQKEQDGQIHGNDPLAVEQAYSRKQNQ